MMPAVLTHRISRLHRQIRRFGDGWQSGFAKSALPVGGRIEVIKIAEMLSVTPPFEDFHSIKVVIDTAHWMPGQEIPAIFRLDDFPFLINPNRVVHGIAPLAGRSVICG